MKESLLVEINQMRKMMGLNSYDNIILESATGDILSTMFNRLFRADSRSIIKSLISSEEKNLVTKFLKGEIMDDVEKTNFSNFIKSVNGQKTIDELKLLVKKARTRTKNPISDADELIYNKIIADMEKLPSSLSGGKRVLDKTWAELGGITQTEINWLEKVHGNNWKKVFYSFFDSVKGMFKSEEKLLDETLNLIKQLDVKGSQNVEVYRQQISKNFEKLTKMRRDNFNRINDWIAQNVPRDVRTRLDKENLNGYGKAKKLAKGEFELAFEKEYGTFRDRIDKFWSQFWAILIPTRGRIAERWGSKSKLYNDLRKLRRMNQSEFTKTNLQELKADFWLGSTLTPKAWSQYYSGAGLKSSVKKYLSEYAAIYFKINLFIASFELLIDAGAKGVEDWEYFKNYKWVHDLSMNFNKNYAKAKGLNSIEEFEEYKKNNENLKLESGELGLLWGYYLKDQFMTLEGFIPGLWDNALKGMYDFVIWYTDPNTKINNEEYKRRVEDAKKSVEEAKRRLKDQEQKITDSLNTGELAPPVIDLGSETSPTNDTIPVNDTKTDTINNGTKL